MIIKSVLIKLFLIKKNKQSLILTIEYKFRIWAGWCDKEVKLTGAYSAKEQVLSVNNITIEVKASTIKTDKQFFKYINPQLINKKESIYELENSELMMYNSNDLEQNKLSYKTAQSILSHYNIDRRIITFDLLNPKRYEINEGTVYDITETNLRYIQENDIFTIYDEHFKSMGDFRVIKCNPIWDGSFHILITAIKK